MYDRTQGFKFSVLLSRWEGDTPATENFPTTTLRKKNYKSLQFTKTESATVSRKKPQWQMLKRPAQVRQDRSSGFYQKPTTFMMTEFIRKVEKTRYVSDNLQPHINILTDALSTPTTTHRHQPMSIHTAQSVLSMGSYNQLIISHLSRKGRNDSRTGVVTVTINSERGGRCTWITSKYTPPQLVSHCQETDKHTVFSIQQVSNQNQVFFSEITAFKEWHEFRLCWSSTLWGELDFLYFVTLRSHLSFIKLLQFFSKFRGSWASDPSHGNTWGARQSFSFRLYYKRNKQNDNVWEPGSRVCEPGGLRWHRGHWHRSALTQKQKEVRAKTQTYTPAGCRWTEPLPWRDRRIGQTRHLKWIVSKLCPGSQSGHLPGRQLNLELSVFSGRWQQHINMLGTMAGPARGPSLV